MNRDVVGASSAAMAGFEKLMLSCSAKTMRVTLPSSSSWRLGWMSRACIIPKENRAGVEAADEGLGVKVPRWLRARSSGLPALVLMRYAAAGDFSRVFGGSIRDDDCRHKGVVTMRALHRRRRCRPMDNG